MLKLIFALLPLALISLVLSSCAMGPVSTGPSVRGMLNSPMEAEAYIKKNVSKRDRAKFDKAVSDDVLLIDLSADETGVRGQAR